MENESTQQRQRRKLPTTADEMMGFIDELDIHEQAKLFSWFQPKMREQLVKYQSLADKLKEAFKPVEA